MDTALFLFRATNDKTAALHMRNTFPSPHVETYMGSIRLPFIGNMDGNPPYPTFPNIPIPSDD
jgi:hypothetical protein